MFQITLVRSLPMTFFAVLFCFCSFSAAGSSCDEGPKDSVLLKRGTIVTLMLQQRVSSKDSESGRTVFMEVYADVRTEGLVLIASHAHAEGSLWVRKPRAFGRPGQLTLDPENVTAVDGQRIPLRQLARYELSQPGRGRQALAWGSTLLGAGACAASFFALPAVLSGFFIKGRHACLVTSDLIKAEIAADIWVRP